ncbi:MAG: hypothetical protein ACREAR_01305 [Nitrosotalea sp.]
MVYDYSFPFNWSEHFVPDRATDCMPACIAMAAKYWAILRPELGIPTELDVWRRFIAEQKGMTMRGSSVTRVMENLGKVMNTTRPADRLNIVRYTMTNIEGTIQFLSQQPPIPLILIFDRSYMITNNEGGYHACLLYGIDYKKEKKVALVDPNLVDAKEAFPWDLKHFARGWGKTQNLCLAVYPHSTLDVRRKKGIQAKPLTTFMEEYQ